MVYTAKINMNGKTQPKTKKRVLTKAITKKTLKVNGRVAKKTIGVKNGKKVHNTKVNGKVEHQHHHHIMPANVILKKRQGGALTEAEIRHFIYGLANGTVPEYQMSALAMAICFQGMNFDETMFLTKAMVESGKVM